MSILERDQFFKNQQTMQTILPTTKDSFTNILDETTLEENTKVGCSCSKSNCMRLNCSCFKNQGYCSKECRCVNCLN